MLNITALILWEEMATAKDGGRPVWTERGKRFLGKNVAVMAGVKAAEKPGRTRSGAGHMRRRPGPGQARRPPPRVGRIYGEDEFVQEHPGTGAQKIAKGPGRTAACADLRWEA